MEWDTEKNSEKNSEKNNRRNADARREQRSTDADSARKRKFWIMIVAIAVVGILFILLMRYWFDRSESFKGLFAAAGNDAVAEAGPDSEAAMAERVRLTGLISMYIFAVITVLQFVALGVGAFVVQGIRSGGDSAGVKLKQLENAEVFFDIPLYVGLFGTVSAFLVMTFSPQSSRLIAYSSTLIGIIFSLVLRLTLQYPFRKQLIAAKAEDDK